MTAKPEVAVLFVCMGNICRSPAAEGVFLALAQREGILERLRVESAGTLDYHQGELPDRRMRRAAAARGYELATRSRPVAARDFDDFDFIVAMDRRNVRDLHAIAGGSQHHGKMSLLLDWHPASPHADVPDPYYGSASDFEYVLDLCEAACPGLLAEVAKRLR